MTSVALNNLWTYLQGLTLAQSDREWLANKLTEPVKTDEVVDASFAERKHKILPLTPEVEYLSSLHLREFTEEELDADPRLAAIMEDGRNRK